MNEGDEKLKLIFSEDEIAGIVRRMAEEICRDSEGEDLLLVGVLKGSFIFLADLARALNRPLEVDFVRLSTYGGGDSPTAAPRLPEGARLDAAGRDVILVEDIVDTGASLAYLAEALTAMGPRRLRIAVLIDRRGRRKCAVKLDYVGVAVESGFIVGYGIDFDEKYRWLPAIYEIVGRE